MAIDEREILGRLRDAIVALKEVRSQRDALLLAKSEPIAIIGMGCRFPGNANTPESLCQSLLEGFDAISPVPADRWSVDPNVDTNPQLQGTRWGAFIKDVAQFDAAFFGISPREAERMDPQQRVLLEVTWEALERSGLPAASIEGTKTGVFVGVLNTDYFFLNFELPTDDQDLYSATGNGHSFPAGRISYTFGFQGPAVTIDTACSSSLVATHLACQSLRAGDSDLAIVGGVSLMVHPQTTELIAKTGALAPDGRCKSFDARANGFVRGEGCGVVVLKRLSDAQRDGDPIVALIRGSAVNQDGRSTGLTTPNVLAQKAMLEQALVNAQLSAEDIDYIEAHGTGTPLGDPIEMEALLSVFGKPRPDNSHCWVGSIKTNIGHLEAAAGVAGLIKSVLSLQQEKIFPNLHLRTLNPRISLTGTPLAIPTTVAPWPRNSKSRRAGISSFGMSGTNAHVILEEVPTLESRSPNQSAPTYLLPISAKTTSALTAMARSYHEWFLQTTELSLHDLVYTASLRRTHHTHRLALVARTRDEFANLLGEIAGGESPAGVAQGRVSPQDVDRILFVFSGQGSQWAEMGKSLLAEEPVFRAKVTEIDALARELASFSILDELIFDENKSRLGETEIVQPALFALQLGLVELFKSWGIVPSAVIGHSVGEVAAAHVSGALSLKTAVRLVVQRGRTMQKATGHGKMVWVALPADDVLRFIAGREDQVAIAAINDPASVVLSGSIKVLDEVTTELQRLKITMRPLRVNYAFHSPQMDPFAQELVSSLGRVDATPSSIKLYSTVTGAQIDGETLNTEYWGRNIRATVQFAAATRAALDDGYRSVVEIAPHPVLMSNLQQCIAAHGTNARVIATLRRNGEGRRSMLEALGALHVDGVDVDWKNIYPNGGRVVSLPTYPWQRERYWVDLPTEKHAERHCATDGHSVLGQHVAPYSQPSSHYWETRVTATNPAYLADHRIRSIFTFPIAGYVNQMLSAAIEAMGAEQVTLENIVFDHGMKFSEEQERISQVSFVDEPGAGPIVSTASADASERKWVQHARGRVRIEPGRFDAVSYAPTVIRARCDKEVSVPETYTKFETIGFQYGPSFRAVEQIWFGKDEALGFISCPHHLANEVNRYRAHPVLLDACFQVATGLIFEFSPAQLVLPTGIDRFQFRTSLPSKFWVHASVVVEPARDTELPRINLRMLGDDGTLYMEVLNLHIAPPSAAELNPIDHCIYSMTWHRRERIDPTMPNQTETERQWLIFADSSDLGRSCATKLRDNGERTQIVTAGSEYVKLNEYERCIDPNAPSHFRHLFDEIDLSTDTYFEIIYLWGIDSANNAQTSESSLRNDLKHACLGLARVVQALLAVGTVGKLQLCIVTRGAQPAGSSAQVACAIQSALWGLGRTIAMERPEISCKYIDLAPAATDDDATWTIREILHDDGEDHLAFRPDGRYVARIERSRFDAAPPQQIQLHADASYLITGGLGGLGLSLARWMVSQGARYLVLVGRSPPGQAARDEMHAMHEAGAKVLLLRADVSRAEDVESVLAATASMLPPLRGIVHAAGVLAHSPLATMGEDDFWKPMLPKVLGAWYLHELTRSHLLDFFVMYSSASGLFGLPGQASYAAANAFLDALAHTRHALGLPAMSIQWGAFAEVGFAAAEFNRNVGIEKSGSSSLSPQEGLDAFSRLLTRPRPNIGVIRMNVEVWRLSYPYLDQSPTWSMLLRKTSHPDTPTTPASAERQESDFVETLMSTEPGLRYQLLEKHVIEQVAKVLRMDAAQIDRDTSFASLGIDSLMGIEVRTRLQTTLRANVSIADIWTHGSAEKLAVWLSDKIAKISRPPATTKKTPAAPPRVTETSPMTRPNAPTPPKASAASLGAPNRWIVVLRRVPRPKMRLICFPYAGGGASVFASWPNLLPADVELCAIQPPGRQARIAEPFAQHVDAMVESIIPELLHYVEGHFAMFGHCLGAIVMYEVVQRLRSEHGISPIQLFASGAPPPQQYMLPNSGARSEETFMEILNAIGLTEQVVLDDPDLLQSILPMLRSDFDIAAKYVPKRASPLDIPITTFAGISDVFAPPHIVERWQHETSSHFSKYIFAEGHYFLVPERESILRIVNLESESRIAAQTALRAAPAPIHWNRRNMSTRESALRILCFHGLGGSAKDFDAIASMMPPAVEVCGIDLPGHGERGTEAPLDRIEDMVEVVMNSVVQLPEMPVVCIGHDLGALVMCEVAARLQATGKQACQILIVLGAMAPKVHYFAPLHHLPTELVLAALRLFDLATEESPAQIRSLKSDCAALTNYVSGGPQPLNVPILAIVGTKDSFVASASIYAWQAQSTLPLQIHTVDVDHRALLSASPVMEIIGTQLESVGVLSSQRLGLRA